jgi:hypothetical protein
MRFHACASHRLLAALAAAPVVIVSSMAGAQPLLFSVGPGAYSTPSEGYAVNPAELPPGVTNMGYTDGGWMMVPANNLYLIGPSYTQSNGTSIRRGSYVPPGIATGQMENVSIRGLQPGGHYNYFISPNRWIVVVDPQSSRVVRTMR